MSWDPILPHRAIFICDEQCDRACDGCKVIRNGVRYTESILHSKYGPVVNVREWETRFTIEDINGELTYVENID